MNKQTVLVTGASGTVGSRIIETLKKQGFAVKATTSKPVTHPTKDGVTFVKVNLATGEGLKEAFEGVDRAFLLSPPGYHDQYAILSPMIQEAKRRGLKKVVLMTAMGANAVETTPFRCAEIELERSGLQFNIIRPNWFLQNFNSYWLAGILQQNKILLPAGTAKTSFIDARDIADVAASLLVNDELSNRDFDLTGPRAVDHSEVAQAISASTGRHVEYKEIDAESFRSGLLAAGLPVGYADFLVLIIGFLREGFNASVNKNVFEILKREPIDVQQYASDYRAAWKV